MVEMVDGNGPACASPGRSVIVTGASAGLGLECAAILAQRGWHVVLACRDVQRGEAAREAIAKRVEGVASLEVRALDVSLLESVRGFVRELRESARPPLHAVVCNAGVQIVSVGVARTREGFESTFATNHLGHFLLARLLLRDLVPPGRIAFVSSGTHDPKQWTGMPPPRLDDVRAFATGRTFEDEPAGVAGRRRYTTSKLCNVLCAYELARRLREAARAETPAVDVNAFDPGLMPGTGLARDYGPAARFVFTCVLPALTFVVPNVNRVQTSAERLARLIDLDAYRGVTGKYFARGRPTRSSDASYDGALARALWDVSAELAGTSLELTREDTVG